MLAIPRCCGQRGKDFPGERNDFGRAVVPEVCSTNATSLGEAKSTVTLGGWAELEAACLVGGMTVKFYNFNLSGERGAANRRFDGRIDNDQLRLQI